MARPIIDFEVERRKMSHAQLYNGVASIPMYQQDCEQSMKVIKLSKAGKKNEPKTFLECLISKNAIVPENRDAHGELITEVEKFDISADALAEIKSMLVCTISVSASISHGITDAMTDYCAGNPVRKSTNKSLYNVIYNSVYERMEELCGKQSVIDAAAIMGGD